jgi:DNA-binding IclR family transcriptional regulator
MVERAFRLLGLLSVSEGGLTFSDLARALNMSKSSIHGLLKTLEENRAIELTEERHFVLGPRIYEFAQTYIQGAGLRHLTLPAMHRLAADTGETVCLGKVEPKGVRVIECIVDNEQSALHIAARPGQHIPLLAAALGSCVLANWPAARREAFLLAQALPHFTKQSVTSPQQFLARVEETVRTGIGVDHEEYLDGVNAIATSIYGVDGTCVALLWIVGFASRLRDQAFDRAAEQLYTEATAISHIKAEKSALSSISR